MACDSHLYKIPFLSANLIQRAQNFETQSHQYSLSRSFIFIFAFSLSLISIFIFPHFSLTMAIQVLRRGRCYQVDYSGRVYKVTVTKSCDVVMNWIEAVEREHAERLIRNKLLVGIAVQWKHLSRGADLLQLCTGNDVLIVMLQFIDRLPTQLHSFLSRRRGCTLYGFRVRYYKRLLRARKIRTKRIYDFLFDSGTSGMTDLADGAMRYSDWGSSRLSLRQIEYASLKSIMPFQKALQNEMA